MKLICLLKTIYHTSRHWIFGGNAIISGHEYDNRKLRKYRVGKEKVFCDDQCSVCGEKSTTWMTRQMYEQMKAMGSL